MTSTLQKDEFHTSEDVLSIVVRVHNTASEKYLDEALFSLAVQKYRPIQVVVICDPEQAEEVKQLGAKQPWDEGSDFQVVPYVPAAQALADHDARAAKLNLGIETSRGRYIAFLDYDDVVYHHCYVRLTEQLRLGNSALAAGGTRLAMREVNGYITSKIPRRHGKITKADLWHDNILALNSFVIDRSRVSTGIATDQSLTKLEGYFLLLALSAEHEFDLALVDEPLSEYRIGADGVPGSPSYLEKTTPADKQEWQKSAATIEGWKATSRGLIRIEEAVHMVERLNELEQRVEQLDAELKYHKELSAQVPGWKASNEELARQCNSLGTELARRPYLVVRRLMHLSSPVLKVLKRQNRTPKV
jgi:hypothetical protein